MTHNQDWVLARFREDTDRNDPPMYGVGGPGRRCIWLSINRNVRWYRPEVANGRLVGIRDLSMPLPHDGETDQDRRAYSYLWKWVSPKQRAKIESAILA